MTSSDETQDGSSATLPHLPAHKGTISKSGIILGPDGKPCRSCNSYRDMANMSRMFTTSTSKSTSPLSSTLQQSSSIPTDCPPDVEQLGRSTWTLLHSLTATYPSTPTTTQKSEMATFLSIFSRVYPCWVCAEDFATWMAKPGNKPRLDNREDFGRWMCEAHNEVNRKLGKEEFDCGFWKERWADGWKDGRCG